jgi:hypothetical protein
MLQWEIAIYCKKYTKHNTLCGKVPDRNSVVGIATRNELDGDPIPVGARFSALVQTGPGDHPASCTMGTRSFQGVKRPGFGVQHPPPQAAMLEEESSYTSTFRVSHSGTL